jgi:hypothetical protein
MMASAENVVLTPADVASVVDRTESGSFVLMRFSLPDDVISGRVVRAVLSYEVQCDEERGFSVWAYQAPDDWDSTTLDRSWLQQNRDRLDEANVIHFDAADCSSGSVRLDIGRLVRSWSDQDLRRAGLLLRAPSSAKYTVEPATRGSTPELKIMYVRR